MTSSPFTVQTISGDLGDLPAFAFEKFEDQGRDAIVYCAPGESITAKQPLFIENERFVFDEALKQLREPWKSTQPPIHYALLKNARMVGECLTVAENHVFYPKIMPDHIFRFMLQDGKLATANGRHIGEFECREEVLIEGTTLFLPSSSPSISHLFFEGLGHLTFFEPNQQKILMFGPEVEAFRRLIELNGYDRENILFRTEESYDQCWRFERLIAPVYHFGIHPRMVPAFERTASNVEAGQHEELLYVSRLESTNNRVMLNEDDVAKMMEKFGFKVLQLSHLGEDEKINLFHKAKVIAGPIGAGLYNALFSLDNPTIIGINSGSYTKSMLMNIVSILDLDYGFFNGPEFLSYETRHHFGAHNDFVINTPQLEKTIGGLLEKII